MREVEKSAGCGRLKKVRGAGGWKKCGRLNIKCGVPEVEKSAGCGS